MNALTYDDLSAAAWAFYDAVRADQRMLDQLGEYCTAEHRARIEARISNKLALVQRFRQAASDVYVQEHGNG